MILVEISQNMMLMLYSTLNTTTSNMFSGKVFLAINTFYYYTIACHPPPGNAPKDIKKKSIRSDMLDKILRRYFKNVSDSNHGDVEHSNTQETHLPQYFKTKYGITSML